MLTGQSTKRQRVLCSPGGSAYLPFKSPIVKRISFNTRTLGSWSVNNKPCWLQRRLFSSAVPGMHAQSCKSEQMCTRNVCETGCCRKVCVHNAYTHVTLLLCSWGILWGPAILWCHSVKYQWKCNADRKEEQRWIALLWFKTTIGNNGDLWS
jgi:hypothetical protein